MSKIKKFNTFIFLTSFVRGMVEYFIPMFLINKNFSLKDIFFFFALHYLIMIILNKFLINISKKIKFKKMLIINAFLFALHYYFLTTMESTYLNLILSAVIFSFYCYTYWSGRLYYALRLLDKKKIGKEIGYIIIFTELALIPSTYIGAFLVEKTSTLITVITISVLALISIIPLFFLRSKNEDEPYEFKEGIKKLTFTERLYIILEQFRMMAIYLFPLFLYENIEKSFRFIGTFNIFVGVATIIFIFFFSKKLDAGKKGYLVPIVVLLAVTWFLKLNVTSIVLIYIIAFFEGLFIKAAETSISKVCFEASYKVKALNYTGIFMLLQNITRFSIFLMAYLFIKDISIFLYICLFGTLLISLLPYFKRKEKDDIINEEVS